MTDIQTRHDLEILLSTFYTKLLSDVEMHRIFNDVAKVDLEKHLPHIADFWEQAIFHTGIYRNNVMQIHLDLND